MPRGVRSLTATDTLELLSETTEQAKDEPNIPTPPPETKAATKQQDDLERRKDKLRREGMELCSIYFKRLKERQANDEQVLPLAVRLYEAVMTDWSY